MRKVLLIVCSSLLLYSCFTSRKESRREKEEKEEYDNPMIRDQQEAERIIDPALGYVPSQRLYAAMLYTDSLKNIVSNTVNNVNGLTWVERGPIYDSVGPSNGNGRGGGAGVTAAYTSGRMRAFLLDTLNDPSGNTAFCAGVSGGIWKCTNFLSAIPNWITINDFFDNLAIVSICQSPVTPSVIYFATGEATSNADATFGKGIWKSTNGGASFVQLPSTITFIRSYKIACDVSGNVYLAARPTTTPVAQPNGLMRSTDGGASWVNITPTGLTSNTTCMDIEFTGSGKLNATFGYLGTVVNHRYCNNPSTVATGGWSLSSGFRVSNTAAVFAEMAVQGEILYAVTINTAYNSDSCYKSTDGGATWTKQNTTVLPAGLGSGQGWYNLTVAINPNNTSELISGGLDAYRSTNDGQTWTRITFWVTTAPYVHADHHYMQYWMKNGETRLIIGCDGGLFYSTNNGATFVDKNRGLSLKQFYGIAIHPTAGSPYLLAGAQDNGVHQLKNPGLSYSIEVTGGDGCITHINQQNPQIQFGSYVYNQYRRSVNGGATWSSVNLSGTLGLFVNPFDYDDGQNIMYCSNGANGQIRRWPNANTAAASVTIPIALAGTASLTALKVSPYTANRVFLGTNNGRLLRLDNASTVVAADIDANVTSIAGATFPAGNVNCINTGTDDQNLVTVFSNYGVSNVWVTANGGTSWTAVDGNLPDMPIRWAIFEPGNNNKMYLATETGIWATTQLNGASTLWVPEAGFPNVRVSMLKLRASDSTIAAGTYGRGAFTAKITSVCIAGGLTSQPTSVNTCSGNAAVFTVSTSGTQISYQWQVSSNGGANFTDMPGEIAATLTIPSVTTGMNNNQYRAVASSTCMSPVTSSAATLSVIGSPAIVTQPANPLNVCVGSSGTLTVAGSGVGVTYQWQLSTDGGNTFNNIAGATGTSYTVTTPTIAMNNYQYRVILSGTCLPAVISVPSVLSINPLPAVTLTALPFTRLFPGISTNLLASVSPNAGSIYTWYWNGAVVPNAGNDFLPVTVDGLGSYYVKVTDIKGCTNTSNTVVIGDSLIRKLFVYPNPNNGIFVVRYYTSTAKSVVVYDAKGSRVFAKIYPAGAAYDRMDIDLRRNKSAIYFVALLDEKGKKIAVTRVFVH